MTENGYYGPNQEGEISRRSRFTRIKNTILFYNKKKK